MITPIFALTAGTLCLYFAFAAGFDAFSGMYAAVCAALLLGPAACACGRWAARRDPRLRFAFLPLPLLALLLVRGAVQALLLAPALVYPAAVLLSARFSADYNSFRKHILWSGGALLLYLVILSQTDPSRLSAILFGAASLILGFFTLRQLRFDAPTGPKQKALELLSLSAVPAGVGLTLGLVPRLRGIFGWLETSVFLVFSKSLMAVVDFVYAILNSLGGSTEETETTAEAVETTVSATEAAPSVPEAVPVTGEKVDRLGAALLYLALTAALLLALIWIIRRLRETRREDEPKTWKQPETGEDGRSTRVREKPEGRSNRRRLRRVYEQYLELLQKRRFTRAPQDNSEDILEKTRGLTEAEAAEALRRLYLRARYDPEAVVTNAQVREAKRLLKELREEEPERK